MIEDRSYPNRPTLPDCAALLQQNLDEEKATDKKLTAMAESKVNRPAA